MYKLIILLSLISTIKGHSQSHPLALNYHRCLDKHCYTSELLLLKPDMSFKVMSATHSISYKQLESRGQWKAEKDSVKLQFRNSGELKFLLKRLDSISFLFPIKMISRWPEVQLQIRQSLANDEELRDLMSINPAQDESYRIIVNRIMYRVGAEVLYEKMGLFEVYISKSE
jgi:hypothetical protein